ncbi:hypothetical protein [Sphingobacterium suaedae]|uniref:Uncharacterized protein n=1 Tax=Sphingobacterium suaedae TaxID=1686402 RepID=A0ABW5KEH9_9SPHI
MIYVTLLGRWALFYYFSEKERMKAEFTYNDEASAFLFLRNHVRDIYGECGGVSVQYDAQQDLLWVVKYFFESNPKHEACVFVRYFGSTMDATGTRHYGLLDERSLYADTADLKQ